MHRHLPFISSISIDQITQILTTSKTVLFHFIAFELNTKEKITIKSHRFTL
jgi:hypothetical protein